jgi:ribonuclease BN (tRNA processing enzyme)
MIPIHPNVFIRSSHVQKLQSVVLVTDAAIVVVDPGFFPDEVAEIRNFASQFEESRRAKYLVLTHSDFDHIAGVRAFSGYNILAALEFPFIFTSYVDYLLTLGKLRRVFAEHEIELVISQHGPAAATAEEIQHRIDLSEDYIRRLEYLVQETVAAGLNSEAAVLRSQDFLYDNKPIPIGIQSLHDNNVQKVYKEILAT